MDQQTRLIFTIIPALVALGGLYFVFLGIRRLAGERAFAARAAQAPGTVIGFRTRIVGRNSRNMGRRAVDFPIVRYAPLGGPEIEFEAPNGTRPRVVREGQTVTVLYDPADPQHARIQSGCLQYSLPLAFIVLGLFVFLFGGAFAVGAFFLLRALP